MVKSVWVLSFCFCIFICTGQEAKKTSQRASVSYFGEIISHPGLAFNYERDFKLMAKDDKLRSFYYGAELGPFYHRRAMTAFFVQPKVGFRKENSKGRYWAAELGSGYFLYNLPNTFTIEAGEVVKTHVWKHQSIHSLSFHYGFNNKWIENSKWFISPQFYITQPAFPSYTAHFALEIGISKTL